MRCALALAAAALLLVAAPAGASVQQESTFQDDNALVFAGAEAQAATLDELASLGVDRIRVSLFWNSVAPDAKSKTKPSFDASDPGAYPAAGWARYDRLIQGAQARGIGVNLDPTGPAPLWATGKPPRADIEGWWQPSPQEFGAFVAAAAKRYSGSYTPPAPAPSPPPSNGGGGGSGLPPIPPPPPPARAAQASGPLPRVDYWAIWNEPNQAGWLTPQWAQVGGKWAEAAPSLYRGLVDAAWSALQANGHGQDTILVGETAPKGLVALRGETRSIDALRFLRGLYCVDARYRPLGGDAATRVGCPADPNGFADAHPALFAATGWAHHPYELLSAPQQVPRHRDWVTIANLPRLTSALDAVLRAYGRSRTGGMPLYLTEYGYQTNPPDKFGVSWIQQAAYLNESEFLSYTNPNVRTLAQFLLRDGGGDIGVTFQSGLETANGDHKPSYDAYRLPVYLPRRTFRGRTRLRVWGLVRPAPNGQAQKVAVEFVRRRSTTWRRLRTLTTEPGRGYLDARVRVPGTGLVRLHWGPFVSRTVSVTRR